MAADKYDQRPVCIYGLIDPRSMQLRYIGQTRYPERRVKQHMSIDPWENEKKADWIQELKTSDLLPLLVILERVSPAFAFIREKHWITHAIDCGCPLTNVRSVKSYWRKSLTAA